MTLASLKDLLILTIANPRGAAAWLKALDLPVQTGWTAILLASVASGCLGFIMYMVSPVQGDPGISAIFGTPLRMVLIQFAVLALTVLAAHFVGRHFGGIGKLGQALVMVAWLQLPPILLLLVQLIVYVQGDPWFAQFIGIASFGVYWVLLSLFIAELHGFRSGVIVFFGILAVTFLMALGAAFFFAILIGVLQNV